MAKSQETWNKKEAEKNRAKKKKDKEQKKMERRASAKGSSNLDDMIHVQQTYIARKCSFNGDCHVVHCASNDLQEISINRLKLLILFI